MAAPSRAAPGSYYLLMDKSFSHVVADQYYRGIDHFIFDPFVDPQVVREIGNFPVFLFVGCLQQSLHRRNDRLVLISQSFVPSDEIRYKRQNIRHLWPDLAK